MLKPLRVLMILSTVWVGAREADAQSWLIVVHSQNPLTEIRAAELADIFLGKLKEFPYGGKAEPVDQSHQQLIYVRFAREILDKSPSYLSSYWARRIFSGEGAPPRGLADSQTVVKFVATHPDAIGYVEEGTPLEGVKTLTLIGGVSHH